MRDNSTTGSQDWRPSFSGYSHAFYFRGDGWRSAGSNIIAGGWAKLCKREIETLVEGELADPRIGLVRVTAVHVADDGRSAQVLVDVDGDDREADRSLEGLLAAKEYIKHELVERLRLRRAPELYFRLDRSEREKARVEELLARAKKRMKARKATNEKKAEKQAEKKA